MSANALSSSNQKPKGQKVETIGLEPNLWELDGAALYVSGHEWIEDDIRIDGMNPNANLLRFQI